MNEDIWTIPDSHWSPLQLLSVKTLKVLLLSIQGFGRDLCQLRASALTLYTLLSIVPVIALLFGIAKGFGFEKKLQQQLLEQASDQDTMMLQLIEFSQNMLSSTKGGVVAGIGVVVLFWTVIKVIGNIEESFNHIWKVKKGRNLARKLSDYLSLMMLAPVLLIVSSSLTVFVKTKITWLIGVIHLPALGTKMVLYALSFSPLVIMSILFSFIFIFMPNQKIKFKAGVIAGIVTGVMYQLVQWAYITLQIGASSYNAIYGSFAALPLFLVWLQVGWIVVLLGCELSFYIQNYSTYQHNQKFSDLSYALKRNITLQVCHAVVDCFAHAKSAPDASWIALQLKIPVSIVEKSLQTLLDCKLIVKLSVKEEESATYQPSRDINSLTVSSVYQAIETAGRNSMPELNGNEKFSQLEMMEHNLLVKDIQA